MLLNYKFNKKIIKIIIIIPFKSNKLKLNWDNLITIHINKVLSLYQIFKKLIIFFCKNK